MPSISSSHSSLSGDSVNGGGGGNGMPVRRASEMRRGSDAVSSHSVRSFESDTGTVGGKAAGNSSGAPFVELEGLMGMERDQWGRFGSFSKLFEKKLGS